MRTNSTTKKVLSLVLAVCFMVSLLPMMLVSANGGVEITSPSYGGFLAHGKQVVIRVEADSAPTISVDGSVLGEGAEVEAGVYDLAWTPAAYGEAVITAEAGGVTDTCKVTVGNAGVISRWDMDGTALDATDNNWANPATGTAGADVTTEPGKVILTTNFGTSDRTAAALVTEGAYIYEIAMAISAENTADIEFKHRSTNAAGGGTQRIATFKNDGTINLSVFGDNNRYDAFFTPDEQFVMTVIFDYADRTIDIYKDGVLMYDEVATANPAATFDDGIAGLQWSGVTQMSVDYIEITTEAEVPVAPVAALDIVSPANGETFLPGDSIVVKVQATNLPAGESVTVATNGGITAAATQVGDTDIYTATLENVTANDTQILAKAGSVTSEILSLEMSQLKAVTTGTGETVYDYNSSVKGESVVKGSVTWGGTIPDVETKDAEHGQSMVLSADVSFATDQYASAGTAWKWILETEFYLSDGAVFQGAFLYKGTYSQGTQDWYITPTSVQSNASGWKNTAKDVSAGKWHKLRVILDVANATKSIYVDDDLVYEDVSLNSLALQERYPQQIKMNNASGKVWVDNTVIRAVVPATGAAAGGLSVASTEELGRTIPVAISGVTDNISLYANGVLVGTGATVNWTPDAVGEVELFATTADGKFAIKTINVVAGTNHFNVDFEGATQGAEIEGTEGNSKYPAMTTMDAPYNTVANPHNWVMNPAGTFVGKKTGTIFIEADFYRAAGQRVILYLSDNNGAAYSTGEYKVGGQAFDIKDNQVGSQVGANWPNVPTTDLIDTTGWHKLRYIVDMDSRTSSLFIDAVPIWTEQGLSTTLTDPSFAITRMQWQTNSTAAVIDNVRISYDTTYEAPAVVDGVANTKLLSGRNEIDTVQGINYHDTVGFSTDVTSAAGGDVWVTCIAYKNLGNGAVQVAGKNLQKVTLAAEETKTVTGTIKLGANFTSGDYVKVFVWNNNMAPFCDAYVVD